jgi:hypothetical protein
MRSGDRTRHLDLGLCMRGLAFGGGSCQGLMRLASSQALQERADAIIGARQVLWWRRRSIGP